MCLRLWGKLKETVANSGLHQDDITGLGRPSCKDNIMELGRPIMYHAIKSNDSLCLANSILVILNRINKLFYYIILSFLNAYIKKIE